jgi:hypothetical protein
MARNYIATHYESDKIKSKNTVQLWPKITLCIIKKLVQSKITRKKSSYEGKDKPAYGYPECLTSAAWDAYTKNPFDLTTRKYFLSTISLTCIDKTKDTKMTPPYALTFESLTTNVGPVTTYGGKKIDARHYNGYLIIPGIVYHMASKITNSLVTDRYGNQFKVGIINFIARFGNHFCKASYLNIHGAYSKYVDMTAQYANGCTGEVQIIPVTMFLVMLYNACFMYQSDKKSNMLITASDTFDLGANVDHELFMNTLSEYKH